MLTKKQKDALYREHMEAFHGEGFVRDALVFFTGREPGEKAVRQLIEKHGTAQITALTLHRAPIQSYLTKMLEWLTQGKFKQAVRDVGYDRLFHLRMNVQLSDGFAFGIEKNERVSVTKPFEGGESMHVSVGAGGTLALFLHNAINAIGKKDFYHYDAFGGHNCQDFLARLLRASGLLTPEAERFIKQDVEALKARLPGYVPKVAEAITDVASAVGSLVTGNGQF